MNFRDLDKKKKSCFVRYLASKIFLFYLEFKNFVVHNDTDKVDNPPNPAKEDSDENPNNTHNGVLGLECFDDTIDHPCQVKIEDTENNLQNFG